MTDQLIVRLTNDNKKLICHSFNKEINACYQLIVRLTNDNKKLICHSFNKEINACYNV